MAKATKFLVLVGALIGIGAALLFYGSQEITSDIIIQEGEISDLNPMQISAKLDPETNTLGVFVVQTTEGDVVSLSATILDPNEKQIITNSIVTNSFEGLFDITDYGTYTLLIESSYAETSQIVGGIGHVPDAASYSVSMAGFVLLLSGMIGVIVVGIVVIRQRKRD